MVNGQALEVVLVGHFVVVFTCSSGGGDDDVVDAGYYVVRRFISGLLEIVDLVVLVLIGIMSRSVAWREACEVVRRALCSS